MSMLWHFECLVREAKHRIVTPLSTKVNTLYATFVKVVSATELENLTQVSGLSTGKGWYKLESGLFPAL